MLLYTPCHLLALFFSWYFLPTTLANSYFVINTPTTGVQWSNDAVNPITWTKGLLDGVTSVDVELARMNEDGIIFVARDVPASTSTGALNLFLRDVPAGDDYYLLFINSTHGVMYAASQRFAIADTGNGSVPSPASAATVTVSGGPNPTAGFATTFPAAANGVAAPGWRAVEGARTQLGLMAGVVAACVLGGAIAVL
ncbi:hypothetical protein GSI_11437 [Ganoderma sinense ZZ0214-1]|uniref:Transporter n=1 Tax=Ganoderma sinense ZZ0214-1 TaxID=1077348 RepID=A0A2G8RW08_9APHY|nr:hypothetical protein GSI_11437 [Ganoderma sinense ZZ0214-1]